LWIIGSQEMEMANLWEKSICWKIGDFNGDWNFTILLDAQQWVDGWVPRNYSLRPLNPAIPPLPCQLIPVLLPSDPAQGVALLITPVLMLSHIHQNNAFTFYEGKMQHLELLGKWQSCLRAISRIFNPF
jgi:hypothetical protein